MKVSSLQKVLTSHKSHYTSTVEKKCVSRNLRNNDLESLNNTIKILLVGIQFLIFLITMSSVMTDIRLIGRRAFDPARSPEIKEGGRSAENQFGDQAEGKK